MTKDRRAKQLWRKKEGKLWSFHVHRRKYTLWFCLSCIFFTYCIHLFFSQTIRSPRVTYFCNHTHTHFLSVLWRWRMLWTGADWTECTTVNMCWPLSLFNLNLLPHAKPYRLYSSLAKMWSDFVVNCVENPNEFLIQFMRNTIKGFFNAATTTMSIEQLSSLLRLSKHSVSSYSTGRQA